MRYTLRENTKNSNEIVFEIPTRVWFYSNDADYSSRLDVGKVQDFFPTDELNSSFARKVEEVVERKVEVIERSIQLYDPLLKDLENWVIRPTQDKLVLKFVFPNNSALEDKKLLLKIWIKEQFEKGFLEEINMIMVAGKRLWIVADERHKHLNSFSFYNTKEEAKTALDEIREKDRSNASSLWSTWQIAVEVYYLFSDKKGHLLDIKEV